MTSALMIALTGFSLIWLYSAYRMRRQLDQCEQEIRRLKEASGGLESMLATRGRRLDVLLQVVNEAVLRVDQQGRVRAANPSAMELFHIPEHAVFPQSILFFYRNPEWRHSFIEALANLPENARLPDMHVNERVIAPRLAQLGREQALLLCVDITEKYRLEQQRRTFIANLMHDLKTPLTSLLGYARSIESFGDNAELRSEAARVIADEAKHVNHLLDSLLTLDQIEFSPLDQDAACDALDVLNRVSATLEPSAAERKITLQCELPERMDELAMEGVNFERISMNLIDNAIRYANAGSRIEVRLTVEAGNAVLSIEDDGPGIPESHLARVTDRFYRIDRARGRSSTGGHGLGLAIVKELLESHGGSLELSNRLPHGLRAVASVPLQQAQPLRQVG